MTINIPFQFIPSEFLVPGVYTEFSNVNANTSQQTLTALIIGQVLPSGTLGPIATPATIVDATTASTSAVLHFAAVPAGVQIGMQVSDLTTPAAISLGTTVISTTATSVTMSANAATAGVGATDQIQFIVPPAPILITNPTQAQNLCGAGSQALDMLVAYMNNDSLGTLYLLPVIDDPASIAATATIACTGTVTNTSVISLYANGVQVPVLVSPTMTNAGIAAAIVSAINAIPNLTFTASGSAFPVTLTANNKGLSGNNNTILLNFRGAPNNEITPPGLTFTITPFAGGATNPNITVPLAGLGSQIFDLIGLDYTDSSNMTEMATFLNNSTGRWSYLQQGIFGMAFYTFAGTTGACTTFAATSTDSQHQCVLGVALPNKTVN